METIATVPEKLEERVEVSSEHLDNEQVAISYSFAEEQFFQEQARLSYTPMGYAENKELLSFNNDNDYFCTPVPEGEAETITTEEAEVMVQDIQYATVLGSTAELDHAERRKLATWSFFNTDYLNLFHSLNALTGDVDYSKTF